MKKLIYLISFFFLFSSNLKGQTLEGKTFIIQVYEYNPDGKKEGIPNEDELIFIGGKMYSKHMGKEFQFSAENYIVKVDSSKGEKTISFVSISKRNKNEMLIWQGSITGDQIKGTMKWFAMGTTKIFFGTLKYKDQDK